MTRLTATERWNLYIRESVEKAKNGHPHNLDGIVEFIMESVEAKSRLRLKGYGCTGMSILKTVEEVPNNISFEQPEMHAAHRMETDETKENTAERN
jgi:hypothetical protein